MELTEGQKAKILKYLLTSFGAGAAANLTFNLFSYLRDKENEAKEAESLANKSKAGPKIIEIDPAELQFLNKSASVSLKEYLTKYAAAKPSFTSDTLAQALAVLALVGGGIGGYTLADMAHDKIKRDEVKEQADAELENYYKSLYLLNKAKQVKKANVKVAGALSDVLGTGLGIVLLTALGSAWASREFLKKQYPKLNIASKFDHNTNALLETAPEIPIFVEKKEKEGKEEKPQVIALNESVGLDSDTPKNYTDKNESEIDDPFSKLEKFSFEKCASYINESILKLCYEFEKAGKQGSVTNLVKAAAEGHTKSLKDSLVNYNKDFTVFDLADKLSEKFTKVAYSKEKEQLALTWLATDPAISAAIMPQIAAEFIDHTPVISKLASQIPANEHMYTGLLMSSVISSRADAFKPLVKKIASANIKEDIDLAKTASEDETEFADALEILLNSNHSLSQVLLENL